MIFFLPLFLLPQPISVFSCSRANSADGKFEYVPHRSQVREKKELLSRPLLPGKVHVSPPYSTTFSAPPSRPPLCMEISIQLSPQAPRDVFTLIYAYLWSISAKIRSPPRLRKPFCFLCYYCVYRSSMCKYSCWFAGFCQDLGDQRWLLVPWHFSPSTFNFSISFFLWIFSAFCLNERVLLPFYAVQTPFTTKDRAVPGAAQLLTLWFLRLSSTAS